MLAHCIMQCAETRGHAEHSSRRRPGKRLHTCSQIIPYRLPKFESMLSKLLHFSRWGWAARLNTCSKIGSCQTPRFASRSSNACASLDSDGRHSAAHVRRSCLADSSGTQSLEIESKALQSGPRMVLQQWYAAEHIKPDRAHWLTREKANEYRGTGIAAALTYKYAIRRKAKRCRNISVSRLGIARQPWRASYTLYS